MKNTIELLKRKSVEKKGYTVITLEDVKEISSRLGLTQREVEIAALDNEIIPQRYIKNIGTVGTKGQKQLLQSKIAVVGCGGLGGTIVELCARMGIGHLVIIDGDRFNEDNLNRQVLSTEHSLGKIKVEVAKKRVKAINSSIKVDIHPVMLSKENAVELLKGSRVVVDALDNISSRFVLQDAARQLEIPFVHGAIAGFSGQVMTVFPQDKGFDLIYEGIDTDKGIEQKTGNPAPTPTMVASWQVQEVIKVLLNKKGLLRNRLMFFDAVNSMVEIIEIE